MTHVTTHKWSSLGHLMRHRHKETAVRDSMESAIYTIGHGRHPRTAHCKAVRSNRTVKILRQFAGRLAEGCTSVDRGTMIVLTH
jgi:hypothetical protein